MQHKQNRQQEWLGNSFGKAKKLIYVFYFVNNKIPLFCLMCGAVLKLKKWMLLTGTRWKMKNEWGVMFVFQGS